MRSKAYLVLESFMIVAVIGLNIAFLNDYEVATILLKSTASLLFVLAGICGYVHCKENRGFSRPILIAVICCMAGDIFLAFDSDGLLFMLGVLSFATAHILFLIAFCQISPVKKEDVVTAITLLICFFAVFMFL